MARVNVSERSESQLAGRMAGPYQLDSVTQSAVACAAEGFAPRLAPHRARPLSPLISGAVSPSKDMKLTITTHEEQGHEGAAAMGLADGKVQRERHSTNGNAALLVVVDGGGPYWERCIVDETVLVALEHFGMPYRLLDLARERPTATVLSECAGILLAQNHLGEALSLAETRAIAAAVEGGSGLVNLDCDLRLYKEPLLEIFGFEGIGLHPCATDVLRIRERAHYITGLQDPGEYHCFDRMVTATVVEGWGEDVVPLAEGILGKEQLVYIRHLAPWSAFEPRNVPLLFATRRGDGKAVQFALNMRVWRRAFYGHARGMDDLFWRSILWAVRKPFAANMIPPLVTMSFDDCQGRHDFEYAEIASRHGFVPMPSMALKRVPERLYPTVREGVEGGRIRFGAHALDYYELLVYDFGKGEYSKQELERVFALHDAFWAKVGTTPGPTLRLHWGEYGVRALPFLKERGYRFFCPALQTGLHKADMSMEDGFWPYDLQTCYYDYLPDDGDFFGFAAMLARHQEDFLTGCTAYLRESETNDVEKAAQSAAGEIRHGLRAGFSAEIVTHEQKFEVLSMDEWERILCRLDELTDGWEVVHAGHDEIGQYLQGKDGVWIAAAEKVGERFICRLAGRTATPLRLSVFRDEGEGVVREYREVEAFEGSAAVEVA